MTSETIKVLAVDDEERLLEALIKGLKSMGYDAEGIGSAESAIEALEGGARYDVVLTDLVMPGMDGMEFMRRISEAYPGLPVIILTGHGSIQNAVQAMQEGAFNYITKPYNLDEVDAVLRKAAEHGRLLTENISLREQVERKYSYAGITGESAAMQKVYKIIDRVKDTGSTVLITGESGTGKELVAKAIHYSGSLKDRPMVTVDCGALTETLLESELFGHVKGSFTGAHRDHAGYFETAHTGTIFLDEIGEFSMGLQTRLLRVLQDGEFSRVGDSKTKKVNVRIIAATNRDLATAVSRGAFREDLFYRLNVITIHTPPLRDRVEDIPLIANHFLEKYNEKLNRKILRISPDTMEIFMNYPWPGNVRELENIMERMMTFCDHDALKSNFVPDDIKTGAREAEQQTDEMRTLIQKSYKNAKTDIINSFTKDYLEALLRECGGKIKQASNISGMDRTCLYRLMKKFDVERDIIFED